MTAITLLDGGMGQELIHRFGQPPTPLWGTHVMREAPHLVADIHRDYFAAGAHIATTNTYAILRDRLRGPGMEHLFEDLHDLALTAAESARQDHPTGRIAGSIGPLGASYRADIHPDVATATPLYAEIAGILAPRCDLLIAETVVGLAQTESVLTAMKATGKPAWIAFSVDDTDGSKLRSGEPLSEAIALANDADALLANCSAPEAMPAALAELAQSGKPFGAYANAFTMITKDFLKEAPTVDALTARRDLGPEAYADHALHWAGMGATILGGCCETGPAHIAALARRLLEKGYQLV